MRCFLIILLIHFSVLASFAQGTIITTPSYNYMMPYHRYYPQQRFYSHSRPHNSDFQALEKYTFNKSYPYESYQQRLQRLERQAFGEEQQGDFFNRYEKVKSEILRKPTYRTPIPLRKQINNYYSGQTTGYTPQITTRVLLLD